MVITKWKENMMKRLQWQVNGDGCAGLCRRAKCGCCQLPTHPPADAKKNLRLQYMMTSHPRRKRLC